MKKYYNIEGMIRSGYKLSRDYETLDFSYARFGDDAVQALAKSRSVKQVRRLTITGKKLTAISAQALAESNGLPNLESLKLYKNKIKLAMKVLNTWLSPKNYRVLNPFV